MKARVKATGEIIEVEHTAYDVNGRVIWRYADIENASLYTDGQLDFEDLTQGKADVNKNEPDYWDKLRHQYAGMFLQGMIIGKPFTRDYVEDAYQYATALVNRFKEEEK